MTRAAFIALLTSDPSATDDDDVRFFLQNGSEVSLQTLDRVGRVDGIYPGTEPNVNAFLKLTVG